jgi:glycosyltransferase involved in cell wall biosynthesis
MKIPNLSIVIIARNEEETLSRALPFLLEESRIANAEIIYVDSASSDGTMDLIRRHPITAVRLEASPLLCPSAGRYMGNLHSRGKFVYFLDGDMIPIPGWIRQGLGHFQDRPTLGGVIGRIYFVLPGEKLNRNHPDDFPTGSVRGMGLSGIYRKDLFDRIGTFHPHARGEEEVELGYRIIQAGYTLERYDQPMAYHLDKVKEKAQFDQKAMYFVGTGQVLRSSVGTELFWRLVKSTSPVFAQQAVVLIALTAVAAFLLQGNLLAALGVAAAVFLVLGILLLWKGPERLYLRTRSLLLITRNILRGFRMGLPEAAGFEDRLRFTVERPAEEI